MRLVDYLDKGAQLGAHAPCLTLGGTDLSYAQVQRISWRVARGLQRAGIKPGDKVAVLSSNDAMAFATVFGISRAGCVWCPINPRNEAGENAFVLDAFDCAGLVFHGNYAAMVEQMRSSCPSCGRWSAWTSGRASRRPWTTGSKAWTIRPSTSRRPTTWP
jgi:fatty-acyl-CoA synthase